MPHLYSNREGLAVLDIPDLRLDPMFVKVHHNLKSIQESRITILREKYDIVGVNQTGGLIRPKLLVCDIYSEHMFDRHRPCVGDIVSLGSLYTKNETTVLICRLAKYIDDLDKKIVCPKTNCMFSWQVDAITEHYFEATS